MIQKQILLQDAQIVRPAATLDTLNELAAALGDDPNFAHSSTANSILLKANISSLANVGPKWII